VLSLEKEIMRLQEVLKDREAEIAVLEGSLKKTATPNGVATAAEPITPPASVNGHANPNLSPKTISQFDNIRRSMSHEPPHVDLAGTTDSESDMNGSVSEQDESLERLNELML
jgi:kinesin family protein 4/21/27